MSNVNRQTAAIPAILALMFAVSGCAGSLRRSAARPVPGQPGVAIAVPVPRAPASANSEKAITTTDPLPPAAASAILDTRSATQRLASLAAERTRSKGARSARLGPGDVVQVTVFDLDELNRTVRVARSGELVLPLIGKIHAAGMTEAELAQEIASRLSRDFLQNPQVDIFISEYRSQLVAVTGAVTKPGLYPLTSRHAGILDLLSEAGGLSAKAGPYLELIPAGASTAESAFRQAGSEGANPSVGSRGIPIETAELMRGSNPTLASFQLVPGDVLYVPEGGSFAVEGWVEVPGAYPVTRGATVLSAISAAGGESFPADLSRVELLRDTPGGEVSRQIQVIDVAAVRDDKGGDVGLRAGDVIRVPASPMRLPPWLLFQGVRQVVRLGASVVLW